MLVATLGRDVTTKIIEERKKSDLSLTLILLNIRKSVGVARKRVICCMDLIHIAHRFTCTTATSTHGDAVMHTVSGCLSWRSRHTHSLAPFRDLVPREEAA